MVAITNAAVQAAGTAPDVGSIPGINGQLILGALLGLLVLVIIVQAIKMANKSDSKSMKATLEWAGNNAIIFLVLVFVIGGTVWVVMSGAAGSLFAG